MPPKVTRQTVPGPGRAVSKPQPTHQGSILSEASPIQDLDEGFIRMVVYGENRVGKTTLACQFPKPLLLVGLEPTRSGGALSVRGVADVQFVRLDTFAKVVRLAGELKVSNPFATVVLDSATSLQDIILKEVLNLAEVPTMLSWGTASKDQYRERSEKTREALRPYLDLDCHVVVTAKQRDHNPPRDEKPRIVKGLQQESFFAADLGGATVGWLHDACDYICQLSIQKEVGVKKVKMGTEVKEVEYETGRLIRRLRTMYHPNYAAGFRSMNPEAVPEYIDEPTYDKIAAVISGGNGG